jgi:hypothetical protein
MTRSSIIRGPAKVTYRSAEFWSQGDIETNMNLETFEIQTSVHGKVDERMKDVLPTVTLTPTGEWENLGVLFPYMSNQSGAITTIGSEIFTASGGGAGDSTLVIHTLAGTSYTFNAAAITKMPDIILASTKTLLGPVTWGVVRKDDTPWSTADSLVIINEAAGAPSSTTTFDPANILTLPYTCAWQSPLATFQTKEGLIVSFDCGFDPTEVDGTGTMGMTLQNIGVMARMIPVGITEANLMTALKVQGTGAVRGRSLLAVAADFTASPLGAAAGPTVVIKNAAIKQAGYRFGSTVLRIGETGFVAARAFPAGVAAPLFTVV